VLMRGRRKIRIVVLSTRTINWVQKLDGAQPCDGRFFPLQMSSSPLFRSVYFGNQQRLSTKSNITVQNLRVPGDSFITSTYILHQKVYVAGKHQDSTEIQNTWTTVDLWTGYGRKRNNLLIGRLATHFEFQF
jgi:hypothetical protein